MKTKTPKPRVMWATTNPSYPDSHALIYYTRRVCDAVWGRRHTRKIHLLTIREDDVETLVERAAKAIDPEAWTMCSNYDRRMRAGDQSTWLDYREENRIKARAALTAAGIPCKQRRAKR